MNKSVHCLDRQPNSRSGIWCLLKVGVALQLTQLWSLHTSHAGKGCESSMRSLASTSCRALQYEYMHLM